ncbi:hypothetical protein [Psychroserpens jangbogonensis]|uniref:hypothetical protein n=1 Tax=Psychroserpens jangbogonensis TaxID=1484460 RepID=UPI00053DA5AD|nr:hypothetical protein [Psychroserpens jangbogonensis]
MKTFINKTVLILLTFSIGIIAFVLLIHYTIKRTSDFNLSEEYKYLIFGHSHPECAFDDDLLENFKNLSLSGESYFFTYQKVKEIIPNNNIQAVFIEYSNSLIDKKMDEWIWGHEKMNAYFPWHSPFMKKDDMLFLYEKNSQDFLNAISTSTRNNLSRVLSFDFITIEPKYGGYKKLIRNNIEEEIQKLNTNTNTPKARELSIENLNYLEKIINYCNINNVKVFLIRSPQHKYFPRENEKALLSLKKQKFENLDFLDFDKFPLKDNQFGDFGHINYQGAEVFSLWFNELIQNGLLSINKKTEFINKEIEKFRTYNIVNE